MMNRWKIFFPKKYILNKISNKMGNMTNLFCFFTFYIGFLISYNLQIPNNHFNLHCVLTHGNFRMCFFYLILLLNGSSYPINFRYLVWFSTVPILVWQICILFNLLESEEYFWSLLWVHYLSLFTFWLGDTFVFLKGFSFIISSFLYSHCFHIIETSLVTGNFHLFLYLKILYFFYGMSYLISNYQKRLLIYNFIEIYLFFIPIFFQENIEFTKNVSNKNDIFY
jgi:hypothetical protein